MIYVHRFALAFVLTLLQAVSGECGFRLISHDVFDSGFAWTFGVSNFIGMVGAQSDSFTVVLSFCAHVGFEEDIQ